MQVGIYVYIPRHCKYQIKPHWTPWFSAACAAAIGHINHFSHLYQKEKNLRQINIQTGQSPLQKYSSSCKLAHANELVKLLITSQIANSFFFFYIYNLHFFEQKTYSHQVLIYLNVPGISVRKPLQNRQIVSWRTTGCEFRGYLCKLLDWETFINEQKG